MPTPELNPEQHQAVHTLRGPLLVLAGAGSGKTRVITYRIAHLIHTGTAPDRILAVTFTNKAAREMRERVTLLLGKRRKHAPVPEISTFHSLCVRILRRHAERLGYPKRFSIYDQSDQETLARRALREIKVDQETLRPSDLLHLIGAWKSQALRPKDAEKVAKTDRELLGALAYQRYQEALRASGAMDFDDLLLLTEELFATHAEVTRVEQERFDHVLIDEYQDTNPSQYRIVKALAARHQNLCVVGDDDQAIYGWRGAEVTHILNFAKDWAKTRVVKLEDNYRSVASILALANTLIAHNSTRHDKSLRAFKAGGAPPRFVKFEDEVREASQIAGEIARITELGREDRVRPGEIAILFRTNEQPRAFEVELRRSRVAYVLVGSKSFYDRKEVRDLLAYFKVIAQPQDEVSLLRILNTPQRGIGSTSVQALLKQAVAGSTSLWNVLGDARALADLPAGVAARIGDFVRLITEYRAQSATQPLHELGTRLLGEIGYRQELERCYKTATEVEARWASLEELINTLAQYVERSTSPSLDDFLEETVLGGRDDHRDDKDRRRADAITLMTLHSAKGLEYEHVYLVGLEEGLLPHRRSVLDSLSGGSGIAEERRLCYVGVTRARTKLTLSFCEQRMKWGKLRPSIPSRFLMEMRGETEKAQRAAAAAEAQLAQEGSGGRPSKPSDAAGPKKRPRVKARSRGPGRSSA